jgi:hypothetical protein
MSGNKLLNENTIRRFMKLANVNGLTNNFISEKFEKEQVNEEEDEDEVQKEGMYARDDEDEMAPEGDMPEEGPDDEMDMDMEMDMGDDSEGEMGAADISLTEEEAQLLIDLGERLSAAMGSEEEDMDDEPMDDEPMDDEVVADNPMGDEPAAEEDPAMGDRMYENRDEIVNEVLKRVTKRIVAQRRK